MLANGDDLLGKTTKDQRKLKSRGNQISEISSFFSLSHSHTHYTICFKRSCVSCSYHVAFYVHVITVLSVDSVQCAHRRRLCDGSECHHFHGVDPRCVIHLQCSDAMHLFMANKWKMHSLVSWLDDPCKL